MCYVLQHTAAGAVRISPIELPLPSTKQGGHTSTKLGHNALLTSTKTGVPRSHSATFCRFAPGVIVWDPTFLPLSLRMPGTLHFLKQNGFDELRSD